MTAVVRKIDELGRIVLPMEFRKELKVGAKCDMSMDEKLKEKPFEKEVFDWLDCQTEVNEIPYQIWNNKYRYGSENFQQWLDRVSNGDEEIKRLIKEQKFLFWIQKITIIVCLWICLKILGIVKDCFCI